MKPARLKGWFSRMVRPGSLRMQLLSRTLLVMAGLLALIGVFQYVLMDQSLIRNKAESLRGQIMAFPADMWIRSMKDADKHAEDSFKSGGGRMPVIPDATMAFIDPGGRFKVLSQGNAAESSAPELSAESYKRVLADKRWTYERVTGEDGTEHLVVLQPIGGRGAAVGIAQVSVSTGPIRDVLVRQLVIFLGLSLLAMLLGLAAFVPVLKRTLVPLSRMIQTVEHVNAGSLAIRLSDRQGQIEIDRLSASFNGMLERLEMSFEAEKEANDRLQRFVADASHELRTPLTSIHGFVEILLRGAAHQPEQLHRALGSMQGETKRMIKLVNDLLLLARLDRSPELELEEGELADMVREMEPQLRLLAGSRKVRVDTAAGIASWFDPDKMKQVVLNLFQNAIDHTDPLGGVIELSVLPAADTSPPEEVLLTIRDNGPGIEAEHLPLLHDRFYRVDTSRSRQYGGVGLGLSITKSIVDIHGGRIEVESRVGEGSIFTVRLHGRRRPT
ncbi:sensor histidine kinase [Paenibacillus spongiae]|uniref:histidine kinase n=1 Tax=Paenibacillus spongiae TaxID=2909671 RepID=A0ABY5S9J5_9BACL|nr:HAMP domain-containing sensor histidine kinase [Paenibacillus spongiae]UVI29502.1 HAMP domain-containing histidine kinase [Paenibacillus spongiae]